MTRILYVEDEPFLAKIVKETLESKNYEVCLISDGAKVSEAFVIGNFDICILDVMLPNKSGFDIAKDIRVMSKNIPVLFLTAKDQTTDLLKGFEVGGNDYIRKPFSMEELIVRIENLLALTNFKSSSDALNSAIDLGRLYTFYPRKLELHGDDEVKNLSHRESQIMELLCYNKNDIISRIEILKRVWGDDNFYNSRNLDVYITKLRSYLKKDPKLKIITLKGVGYQFLVGV